MICPNCNAADHESGAKFCHKCGMSLINKEESPKPKEDDDDTAMRIFQVIYFILAVLIFFFYANKKFGLILGFFYSLYWALTVPIHFLYWISFC